MVGRLTVQLPEQEVVVLMAVWVCSGSRVR